MAIRPLSSSPRTDNSYPRYLRVRRPAASHGDRSWLDHYSSRLRTTDLIIVTISVLCATVARYGGPAAEYGAPRLLNPVGDIHLPFVVLPLALIALWSIVLKVSGASSRRVIGAGHAEYTRILKSSVIAFGIIAMLDLVFKFDVARGFIAIALPFGTLALLVAHWLWRKAIARRWEKGVDQHQVLVVGSSRSAAPLIEHLSAHPRLGYRVVGLCVPEDSSKAHASTLHVGERAVPIIGTFDDAREAVALSGATTVAVTSAEVLGHSAMRELSWSMEGMNVDILVSPGVTDVAGPRMTVRPVANLPLLHIEKPQYHGANRLLKSTVDRVGAALLLLAFAPTLLVVSIAIKLDSRGPVFYRAERIGLNNIPFHMWKFRSMVVDADKLRDQLAEQNEGNGVLFKIRDDPRVTRVGAFLRRFSVDEIPQLFNVLFGSMSLVGPRPPLREEVDTYDDPTARRMLVRPGMTGLWQVSGRSDLSWEESVRLDLSYVENWSITHDLMIMWKTARAVISSDGAY